MKPPISLPDPTSEYSLSDSKPSGDSISNIGWPAPLLDGLCAIASRKWIVAAIIAVGLIFGCIRLAQMPKIYKASAVAVLMPREKPNLDAAIDTSSIETSDDRASRSQSGNLMLPPNPNLYTTIMGSRATLTRIGEKFASRLGRHISSRDRSVEVYLQLKSMISMTSTEEGLITVSVASQDPKLSSDIANELFEECRRASQSIEKQLILQQAGHLDKALESARIKLGESKTNSNDSLHETVSSISNYKRATNLGQFENSRRKRRSLKPTCLKCSSTTRLVRQKSLESKPASLP